ncbi:MAG TPA: ABC transporter permease [Terriglobales bacterium]|nr:ABC transporter permease [Terriglobales bacterium]
MTTQSNAFPDSSVESRVMAPAVTAATRPFSWSVRRELWENRSIYIAPLAVAGLALLAFLVGAFAGIWEKALRLDPEHPQAPFDLVAGLMMGTGIIVTVFYCLDALHSERRDRSILFWKSLPVSDLTTVAAKASIPLVVVPLLTFAVTVAMHWIMLLLSSVVLLAGGQSVATLWTHLPVVQMWLLLLYHLLTAHALWPAPVYCWLLLVSGWARRAALVWALLPVVAIAGFEKLAFHTSHFATLVGQRFIGDVPAAAHTGPHMFPTNPMVHITPGQFLVAPGLWIGLAIAAAFLAVAVRLRRSQGPV